MKTRKFRRSLGFVVVSELTVAAHLLFFLPPQVRAAIPTPPLLAMEEPSGESALAALRIERAEATPQETVEVNKTVPQVEPPAPYPTFSPIPTDEELFRARVFGEPLIPEEGETNDAENQALAQAITTYLYGGDSEALEPLEGVVTTFPQSRWRVAVQAGVGSWYRRKGYFTRGQRNLLEAWRLGKDSQTEGVRKLAEFAAGELMILHMQFGQVDPLEALVTEFAGRDLSGGITEKLSAAQGTVWGLRNDHEKSDPLGLGCSREDPAPPAREGGKGEERPEPELPEEGLRQASGARPVSREPRRGLSRRHPGPREPHKSSAPDGEAGEPECGDPTSGTRAFQAGALRRPCGKAR